jgi:GGDEF domain-containing protein
MRKDGQPPVRKAVSPQSAAKRPRSQPDRPRAANQGKRAKAPSRSEAMRLAQEVDRLAAQLEQSRARITDLETKVDIDPLTELLNRRSFERELKRSVAYVKRYGTSAALVLLDIDELKPVNNRHGGAARDAVLKAAAAALVRQVRASDVVARIGGDEFVVLLWNVSGPAAVAKAAALEKGDLFGSGAVGRLDAGRHRLRGCRVDWSARCAGRPARPRRRGHERPQGGTAWRGRSFRAITRPYAMISGVS